MDTGIGILGSTPGGGGNISAVIRLNFFGYTRPAKTTGRTSGVCDIREASLSSRGIWKDDEYILFKVMPATLVHLIMFVILSQTLQWILKPLKQPRVVSYTLAGIALGPSLLAQNELFHDLFYSPRQMLLLNTMATVGMVYYTFLTAVKLDTDRIFKAGKRPWVIGLSSSIPSLLVVMILSGVLYRSGSEVAKGNFLLRFAISVSMSAFMNLVPSLEELDLITTDLAQLAMSSSLLNDVMSMVYWVCSSFVLRGVKYGTSNTISICLLAAFTLFFVHPLCKWIVQKTPDGGPVDDFYVKIMLHLPLVVAAASDIGLSSAYIGVIVIGLAVPEGPPLGSEITQKAELVANTVLLPFFFLALGAIVDVHSITDWDAAIKFQLVIVVGYTVKLLSTFLSARACNLSFREALTITMMMDVRGVADLIVFRGWNLRKVIAKPFLTQCVFSSMVAAAIATPLSKALYRPEKPKSRSIRGRPLEMQSTLLHSELRIVACVHGESDVPGIITLVEASNPTDTSPICLHVIHLLELVGRATPLLIPHKKHKRMCKHNGCVHILNAFKNYCEELHGLLSIQLFTMVAPFRNMHEGICRLAHDKRTPLLIIPFLGQDQSFVAGESNALTKLNSKIQAIAPCTVGIFVNRVTQKRLSGNLFSYGILVIFFGGEDDREALAYGARMAGHPGVTITVLHMRIQNAKKCGMRDWALDSSLLDEFRTNNLNNPRATYLEVQVWDLEKAIEVIQSIDDNYDLVIVGQRPGMHAIQEVDMCALIENPELGFIGDMIMSPEFHGGKISLLVMQHCNATDGGVLSSFMNVEGEQAPAIC